MADEQYRWLDRETAELLLRGESLEVVDPADHDRAARLAETLGALSAVPPQADDAELPGEAAALAAFRKVRAEKGEPAVVFGGARHGAADAGLVRIGAPARADRRPRWARPLRLGLAASVAAVMVGGVAAAAGTGLLPTPFGGDEPVVPGASVSAAASPDRPLASTPPRDTPDGGTGTPEPSGSPSGPAAGAPPQKQNTQPGGEAPKETPGTERHGDGFRNWWGSVTDACRDVRAGKELHPDRRRALEGMAGGSGRVTKYCEAVLNTADGDDEAGDSDDRSGGHRGDQRDNDEQDRSSDEDDDGGIAPGDTGDDNSMLPKRATTTSPEAEPTPSSPAPTPSPSYSALSSPAPDSSL
ncbi:hypothetical protein QQY66_30565 [Streptomyces sp. DG2A-72]|uniref:hypothetical protein n=1 Tax=Streptomyces sp. DG2A-72 TaxID=3051386 RepID=UPI00265B7462|nr:hypothetical protein [Streptomyces sp. DG2A-72]MDO0935817.1 hypothetical protein [Streptomyces sp. DG2A-72]